MKDHATEKYTNITEDHKILLKQLGHNFTLKYGTLGLSTNPEFKKLPQNYKNNIRAWYSYNRTQVLNDKEARIPKATAPNMLLAGLFKKDDVDLRLANYLASVLEKYADKKVLAQIAADHVKKVAESIDDINNAQVVAMAVGAIWPPL